MLCPMTEAELGFLIAGAVFALLGSCLLVRAVRRGRVPQDVPMTA
jgi:hypothetical protein